MSGIKNLGKNAQRPRMCCYEPLQNLSASLKAIGVLTLLAIYVLPIKKRWKMEMLKSQILESKQEEFQCVLLAKISSLLELCNVTKSLLTGGFSHETIYYLFGSNSRFA